MERQLSGFTRPARRAVAIRLARRRFKRLLLGGGGWGLRAVVAIGLLAGGLSVPEAVSGVVPVVVAPAAASEVPGGGQGAGDDPALRTRFSSATVSADGVTQRSVFEEPVNYKDDAGDWQPIDSTLVDSDRLGYAAQNAANSFDVLIPNDVDQKPVRIEDGATWLTFTPAAAEGSPVVDGPGAAFDGPTSSTEFDYVVAPTGLKESINLATAPSAAPTYRYSLDLSTGLTPQLAGDGSLTVSDGDGDVVYSIPAPTMVDGSNTEAGMSSAIGVSLTESNDAWSLVLTPDFGWLSDPARVYPVAVDPTVTVQPTDSGGHDCWIDQAAQTTKHCANGDTGNDVLWVGQDGNSKARRSLLKFPLSSIPPNANISQGDLSLWVKANTATNGHNDNYDVKRIKTDANDDWTDNATWVKSSGGSTSNDFWTDPQGGGDFYSTAWASRTMDGQDATQAKVFNVKDLVALWVNGDSNGPVVNHGLMIKQTPEENITPYNMFAFWSGDQSTEPTKRPKLVITYTVPPRLDEVGVDACGDASCAYPQGGGASWTVNSLTPTFTADVGDVDATPDLLDVTYTVKQGTTVVATGHDQVSRDSATSPFDQSSWTVPADDPTDATVDGLVDGSSYTLTVSVSDGTNTTTSSTIAFHVTRPDLGAMLQLREPLRIWDTGAELSWTAYRNTTGNPDNDLAEYQIFRGCVTLPGGACTNPVSGTTPYPNSTWQLVDRVAADQHAFTDTTVTVPSTETESATYQYVVVARTAYDVKHSQDGQLASNAQTETMPPAGRVREILTGDAPSALVGNLPDTTLASASAQQNANLPSPGGHPWLQVGDTANTTYGAEHAVMRFDTSAIAPGLAVTDAQLQLTQDGGGGPGGATFELWPLAQGFDEGTATWHDASAPTIAWTTPGGTTAGASALATFTTTPTATGPLPAQSSSSLTSRVQTWVNNPGQNYGLLLKTSNDTLNKQWINLDSSEVGDPSLQPRLVVEHLIKDNTETFDAPSMPVRMAPNDVTTVPVTVANTTTQSWPADLKLSYIWTDPDGLADVLSSGSRRTVALGRALEPGDQVTVNLPVVAPVNSDTGNKQRFFDIYLDLLLADGTTFASKATAPADQLRYQAAYPTSPTHLPTSDPGRVDAPCQMMAPYTSGGVTRIGGLGCVARVVDFGASDQLGLEKWETYTGEETGAGSQLLANLHTGNLIWDYDAWQTPSVGPGSFVRAVYNSKDPTSNGTARGWSFQAGALNRLGDNPVTSASDTVLTLTDGDGTTHVWQSTTSSGGVTQFLRPPGVHLNLVHDTNPGTINTDNEWVFTSPDGTAFHYQTLTGHTLVPTRVVDKNGNTLSFGYAGNDGRMTSVTDSTGRTVATLAWSANHLLSITNVLGRSLQLTYDTTSNHTDDVIALVDGTTGTGSAQHSFGFAYNPSGLRALNQVTDPRGHHTTVDYYTSNEALPVSTGTSDPMVTDWPRSYTDRTSQTTFFEYADNDGSDGSDIRADVYEQTGQASPLPAHAHTTYLSDAFGRTTKVKDAVANDQPGSDPNLTSNVTRLVWDGDHNAISMTEPAGAKTRWVYDQATGYPLKQFDPVVLKRGGKPTVLAYDTLANGVVFLSSITTPLNSSTTTPDHQTTFGHDTAGNLTSVTDPLGNKTLYTYNPNGTLASVVDANHSSQASPPTTTFAYNAATGGKTGYPTTITPPQGGSHPIAPTTFVYDAAGDVTSTSQTSTTQGGAVTTTAVYDGLQRLTSLTVPGAQGGPRTTTTTYDANDNVHNIHAPNSADTTTDYDNSDRSTTVTLPSNGSAGSRVATNVYDLMGRLVCAYTPLATGTRDAACASKAHSTRYGYDLDGRVTSTSQYVDSTTTITTSGSYDPASGDLLNTTDPNGNQTSYSYDLDHRVTGVTDAAGYSTRTRYDDEGQVTSTVDQDGNPTDYTYDNNGQTQSVSTYRTPLGSNTPQTHTTTYAYDKVGNLTKTTLPSGKFTTTRYDENNNPVEQDGLTRAGTPAATVTFLDYNDLGQLSRQSLPVMGTTTGASPGQPAEPNWSHFTYYPSGQVKTSADPWDITTSYEYNRLGLQTGRTLQGSNSTGTAPVAATRSMTWSYNPDGSLAGRDDTGTMAATIPADPTVTGTWATGTTGLHDGPDYRTHAAAAGSNDKATWSFTPATTGTYKLQLACPKQADAATAATYTITTTATLSSGGTQAQTINNVTLDQSKCDDDQLWYRPQIPTSDHHIPATAQQPITLTLKPDATKTVVADAARVIAPANDAQYTYTYDTDGNQTMLSDNTGNVPVGAYVSGYDNADRLTSINEMSGTDGNGTIRRATNYTYDNAGNPLSVASTRYPRTDPTNPDIGNIQTSATTAYTWDVRNQLATMQTSNSQDKNASNQPLYRTWQWTYDPRGLVTKMTKPGQGDPTPPSPPTSGNDTNFTNYTYYEDGLLKQSTERRTGGAPVDSHQLSYDPDGNRTRDLSEVVVSAATTTDLQQTATYTYDAASRLTGVSKRGSHLSKPETYTFATGANTTNANGGIVSQTVNGQTTTFNYLRGRLQSSDVGLLGLAHSTYHYDAFGRQDTVTYGITNTVVKQYSWDGFDRLVSETSGAGNSATTKTASYDALDRPVLAVVNGPNNAPSEKTRYDYLGLTRQVAVDEQPNSAGTWKAAKTFSYDPAGHTMALTRTPGDGSTGNTRYYTLNPHTDVELLTDPSTGQGKQSYRYTAYGQTDTSGTKGEETDATNGTTPNSDNDIYNPYRYNDKRLDTTTGNYDMGFRTYGTDLNQFLSRDMYNGALNDISLGLDPWGNNRYAFAGGNPITGIELDGHRFDFKPAPENKSCIPCIDTVVSIDPVGTVIDAATKVGKSATSAAVDTAHETVTLPWHFAHGSGKWLHGAFASTTCIDPAARAACAQAIEENKEGMNEAGPAAIGLAGLLAVPEGGEATGGVLSKILSKIFGREAAAKAGDEAFHYTSSRWIESITTNGLRKGSYATPNGSLSPLQASLELALPPNRALPDAAIRIDLAGLRKAGYEIPTPTRVSSTVTGAGGRTYSMPGGGYEIQFPYSIPAEFLKVVPR